MVESLDSRLESNKEEKKKRARARQIETEQGSWVGVSGLGCWVWCLVIGVHGLRFRVLGSG